MIHSYEHIIRAQRFHIELDNQEEAHQVQSNISLLQENSINALLDKVLSKFSMKDNVYQFDKIELDLGVLSKQNYEQELVFRLEEELTNYLNSNILNNGTIRNGKILVVKDHRLAQFEHFLLNGYLKWDASSVQSPLTLLNQLLTENSSGLAELLINHGKKEYIRKRLIYQFDEEPLEKIVTVVAKNESEYIISYKKSMLENQRTNQFVDTGFSSFRNAVWEVILAYLFVESSSYYSRKNFLSYLIQKIAEKYNLTYNLLLEAIASGIKSSRKNTDRLEFKKIIVELRTEQQALAQTDKNQPSQNKISVQDWIAQLNHFIRTGSFRLALEHNTRAKFNQQFKHFMLSNESVVSKQLNVWFRNASARKLLIPLLNDEILNRMITLLTIPSISKSLTLITAIENNQSLFIPKSRGLWKFITSKKARLILGVLHQKEDSITSSIKALLEHISSELTNQEADFIQLLQEVSSKLPVNDRQTVKTFIDQSLQKNSTNNLLFVDSEMMSKIAEEINDFTRANESELWHYWMSQQIPHWLKTTGLNHELLFTHLEKQLVERLTEPTILSLLEQFKFGGSHKIDETINSPKTNKILKTLDWREGDQPENGVVIPETILEQLLVELNNLLLPISLYSEWSRKATILLQEVGERYQLSISLILKETLNLLAEKKIKQQLRNHLLKLRTSDYFQEKVKKQQLKETKACLEDNILFVLEKGVLPWWEEGYTIIRFNSDFEQWWRTTPNHKKIIQLIQRSEHGTSIHKMLNETNLKQLWKILDQSSHHIVQQLIVSVSEWMQKDLLPLGEISSSAYNEFNEQLMKLMLQTPPQDQQQLFVDLLKTWINEKKLIEHSGVTQLLQYRLRKIASSANKALISSAMLSWLEQLYQENVKEKLTVGFVDSIPNYLAGFRHQLIKNDLTEAPLALQLQKIIQTSPETFRIALNQQEFRKSLIKELEEQHIIRLIKSHLNTNQLQYFVESMAVLTGSKLFMSAKEHKHFTDQYFQLLLLKISAGEFIQWDIAAWSNLMIRSMNNTLGIKKTNEVLLKLNNQLLAASDDDYKKGMGLLDQIHQMKLNNERNQSPNQKESEEKEEKPYRKLGEKVAREFNDPIFIKHGGLIILAPYLGMLFEKCGLTNPVGFIDEESRCKAVHLLEYAATGETGKGEHELVVNKLLCGMTLADPVERNVNLSEQDKETVDSLLKAITQQWKALKGTSINGLRVSFLQRDGKLEEEEEQYFLKIEQKAFDMLLDQIPWNITRIKLSWMHKVLFVEWR